MRERERDAKLIDWATSRRISDASREEMGPPLLGLATILTVRVERIRAGRLVELRMLAAAVLLVVALEFVLGQVRYDARNVAVAEHIHGRSNAVTFVVDREGGVAGGGFAHRLVLGRLDAALIEAELLVCPPEMILSVDCLHMGMRMLHCGAALWQRLTSSTSSNGWGRLCGRTSSSFAERANTYQADR